MKVTIHGAILSPWVRRLMAFADEKGLDYELKKLVPFGEPSPEFLRMNPLGKIPVLEVDGRFLPDSLAACSYLETLVADPQLFPESGWDRAWMLWLCDFLATGIFSKVEAPLFVQRYLNPTRFNKEPDQSIVDQALAAMPRYFDYLEAQLGGGKEYLVGDSVSLADLTAGGIFINLFHAGEKVDPEKWPLLEQYIARVLARPSFSRILEIERKVVGETSPLFGS